MYVYVYAYIYIYMHIYTYIQYYPMGKQRKDEMPRLSPLFQGFFKGTKNNKNHKR